MDRDVVLGSGRIWPVGAMMLAIHVCAGCGHYDLLHYTYHADGEARVGACEECGCVRFVSEDA